MLITRGDSYLQKVRTILRLQEKANTKKTASGWVEAIREKVLRLALPIL
jgi:hypothetical protein